MERTLEFFHNDGGKSAGRTLFDMLPSKVQYVGTAAHRHSRGG
jgi:hypothetical protein